MANEVPYDITSGETLYHTRFQLNGDVFVTDGSSDESWGAGGNTAADYDVTMPEKGSSGHYVGNFDTSNNIAAGEYRVTIRLQAGGNPADSDLRIARGTMYWDGTAEISIFTLDTTIEDDVIGADSDTLETLSDQLDEVILDQRLVLNVYDETIPGEGTTTTIVEALTDVVARLRDLRDRARGL